MWIALSRQCIVTSSVFKKGASTLTQHFADHSMRKFVASVCLCAKAWSSLHCNLKRVSNPTSSHPIN
jgi:hypothetical protein